MNRSLLYNDEAVKSAALSCTSIAQMLQVLGVARTHRRYKYLKDWSNRTGTPLPDGRRLPTQNFTKLPAELVFVENSTYTSNKNIKDRLIKDHGWEEKCAMPDCPNPHPTWRGLPLSLHLDHINGISNDNRFENLRFLCPNCHTQTDTYSGRNIRRDRERVVCPSCGGKKLSTSVLCKKCTTRSMPVSFSQNHLPKIVWPPAEEIIELLKTENYVSLGKKYGVSDSAIRKYLKREGVDPLPKGNRKRKY